MLESVFSSVAMKTMHELTGKRIIAAAAATSIRLFVTTPLLPTPTQAANCAANAFGSTDQAYHCTGPYLGSGTQGGQGTTGCKTSANANCLEVAEGKGRSVGSLG